MVTVFCKNLRNFINDMLHHANKCLGGGDGGGEGGDGGGKGGRKVGKGDVVVYVGPEQKEYYVSSKCWECMTLLREQHEHTRRCLPSVSPIQFQTHLKQAKLVLRKKIKPYVPELALID